MRSLFLPILLVLATNTFSQEIIPNLLLQEVSEKQRTNILAGEAVIIDRTVVGKVWPEVQVYRKVNAPAEEMRNIFIAYEKAPSFVPNLISAKVSKRPTPNSAQVDYEIDIPILPNEKYSALNTLTGYGPGGYQIAWTILKGTSIKAGQGYIRIVPLNETQCIIKYANHISPGIESVAGLLKNHMRSQTATSVKAMQQRAEQ